MLLVGHVSQNYNNLSSSCNGCTVASSCYCDDPRAAGSLQRRGEHSCGACLSHRESAVNSTSNGNRGSTNVGERVRHLEDKLPVRCPRICRREGDGGVGNGSSNETYRDYSGSSPPPTRRRESNTAWDAADGIGLCATLVNGSRAICESGLNQGKCTTSSFELLVVQPCSDSQGDIYSSRHFTSVTGTGAGQSPGPSSSNCRRHGAINVIQIRNELRVINFAVEGIRHGEDKLSVTRPRVRRPEGNL
mmetsp:Transcript_6312/g.11479  ORF Transcript_6312/g.11479 Transcript_6312/m.11479 type:complete len:247 (-) Transcript_6312:1279-2019(-)